MRADRTDPTRDASPQREDATALHRRNSFHPDPRCRFVGSDRPYGKTSRRKSREPAVDIALRCRGREITRRRNRFHQDQPIGTHQGIAHPLAKVKIELEQARLLWQKAAALYDAGDDFGAGEYANMAKYAAGEIACNATDVAVHTHGGNGLTVEYGLANMLVAARLGRIAPVSREMILNFVAMHSLGLPKSY